MKQTKINKQTGYGFYDETFCNDFTDDTEQKSSMIQEDKKFYIRIIWSELFCF